jgi:aquaporin Z/aquaporin NIP
MLRWIAGHISSGSMNPARTLGPIIVAGGISAWWVYVTAPLLGMAIAVWLAHRFYPTPSDQETQQSTPHG